MQCLDSLGRTGRLFEQADEPRTDYHAGTVGIGCLTGGPIGYAKTDQERMGQLHRLQAGKVGLLLFIETALCAGGGCRTDSVDETVGIAINSPDALVGRFGRYQEDNLQPIAIQPHQEPIAA